MTRSAPGVPQAGPLRILIDAPSSPFDPERLSKGVQRLEGAGHHVIVPDDVLSEGHAYLNGDDEQRCRRLDSALKRDDVDVLWIARGGYGLTRILSRLEELPERPPLVVGFSDTTALHARLSLRGIQSVHGPLATTLGNASEACFEHCLDVVTGRAGLTLTAQQLLCGPSSPVEGPAFAANLCVLSHLVGTPHFPSLDGSILFFEEVGERPYRIDRMLTQLLDAGCLEGVQGVVAGYLTGCSEARPRPFEPSAIDVISERLAPLGVPVLAGAPFGHEDENFAIPVGARVRLDPARAEVTYLEGVRR